MSRTQAKDYSSAAHQFACRHGYAGVLEIGEAQGVAGDVSDVSPEGRLSPQSGVLLLHHPDSEPQEAVDLPHPGHHNSISFLCRSSGSSQVAALHKTARLQIAMALLRCRVACCYAGSNYVTTLGRPFCPSLCALTQCAQAQQRLPLAVTLCQVVVDSYDVDAFAGQGVQVCRQCCCQGLSFACCHLSDGPFMQGHASNLHTAGRTLQACLRCTALHAGRMQDAKGAYLQPP